MPICFEIFFYFSFFIFYFLILIGITFLYFLLSPSAGGYSTVWKIPLRVSVGHLGICEGTYLSV